MKTLHNISTENKSQNRGRVRSVLTFVGIVTAIICSLVLLQDVHSTESAEASEQRAMEGSRGVSADLLARAASTVWSMR